MSRNQEDLNISFSDLTENPTARVPICLVLDTSGSMDGEPISELNEAIAMFFSAINSDEMAHDAADISIVTFGGKVAQTVEFGSIDRQSPPMLIASGSTPMGQAVETALFLLEERKQQYKATGVDYYQPWIVLMTDGTPTDSITNAVSSCVNLELNKKLVMFPIAIGNDADMTTLAKFSSLRPPLKLKGLRFKELFTWLAKSVSATSQSTPGDRVQLDVEGIKSWASI